MTLSSRASRCGLLLATIGVLVGCSSSSGGANPSGSPTPVSPSTVVNQGKYLIRACPDTAPSRGSSWFTAQSIQGRPGAAPWTATSLIDVGPIDMMDGALWANGRSPLGAPLLASYGATFVRPVAADWLILAGFTVAFLAATIAIVVRKTTVAGRPAPSAAGIAPSAVQARG